MTIYDYERKRRELRDYLPHIGWATVAAITAIICFWVGCIVGGGV